MQTREEAIDWLAARGNYAFEWDTYAPNAFGVATTADEDHKTSGWLLVIRPADGAWYVEGILNIPPAPSFRTLVFDTLEQAVTLASALVTGKP